jgi:hypothetical protein
MVDFFWVKVSKAKNRFFFFYMNYWRPKLIAVITSHDQYGVFRNKGEITAITSIEDFYSCWGQGL